MTPVDPKTDVDSLDVPETPEEKGFPIEKILKIMGVILPCIGLIAGTLCLLVYKGVIPPTFPLIGTIPSSTAFYGTCGGYGVIGIVALVALTAQLMEREKKAREEGTPCLPCIKKNILKDNTDCI